MLFLRLWKVREGEQLREKESQSGEEVRIFVELETKIKDGRLKIELESPSYPKNELFKT